MCVTTADDGNAQAAALLVCIAVGGLIVFATLQLLVGTVHFDRHYVYGVTNQRVVVMAVENYCTRSSHRAVAHADTGIDTTVSCVVTDAQRGRLTKHKARKRVAVFVSSAPRGEP